MTLDYRVVPFGGPAPAPAEELALLHTALLPESPIALLGLRFVRDVYYRRLPRYGLIVGAIAYVDGQPAGFVAATHDARGFLRTALRRCWPHALWAIGSLVVTAPRSLGRIRQAWRALRSRPTADDVEREGEILSLGVLPAYRTPALVQESGRRIATDLLDLAVARLRAMGVRRIDAVVRANNTEAKLFYAGLGWRLRRRGAPGRGTPAVEFTYEPGTGASAHEAPVSIARR